MLGYLQAEGRTLSAIKIAHLNNNLLTHNTFINAQCLKVLGVIQCSPQGVKQRCVRTRLDIKYTIPLKVTTHHQNKLHPHIPTSNLLGGRCQAIRWDAPGRSVPVNRSSEAVSLSPTSLCINAHWREETHFRGSFGVTRIISNIDDFLMQNGIKPIENYIHIRMARQMQQFRIFVKNSQEIYPVMFAS